MYHSKEFAVEIWPGEIRIHQCYETEEQQTIELTAEQAAEFCRVIQKAAAEALELKAEFDAQEELYRQQKIAEKINTNLLEEG